MATRARRISPQEWERHWPAISKLYYEDGLPLHSKEGKPSVQQTMLERHGFGASLAQYETYIRALGHPKNLKKSEWRAVHARLDVLSSQGIEARVKIAGQVATPARLERSRRHAFDNRSVPMAFDGPDMPPRHRVTIETRTADGEWSEYPGNAIAEGSHPDHHESDLFEYDVPEITDLEPQVAAASLEGQPTAQGFSAHHYRPSPAFQPEISLSLSPRQRGLTPVLGSPTSFDFDSIQLFGGIHSLSPDLDSGCSAMLGYMSQSETLMPQDLQLGRPVSAMSAHIETPSLALFRPSDCPAGLSAHDPSIVEVHGLLRFAEKFAKKPLPQASELRDRLCSLLPNLPAQGDCVSGWELTAMSATMDTPFYSVLIFSLMNGFASLDEIPKPAVIELIREERRMSARLFDYLGSLPTAQAQALAENLFAVAVEAGDTEAVSVILNMASDGRYALDPNEIVCRLDGDERRYTPFELAGKLQHVDLIGVLHNAKADINATRSTSPHEEIARGTLELAIKPIGSLFISHPHLEVNLRLVHAILQHDPDIRIELIDLAVSLANGELIRALVAKFSPARHSEYFEDRELLRRITSYLENSLGLEIIKTVFDHCESQQCGCFAHRQDLMSQLLGDAARRGNTEAVEFLIPRTVNKDAGLCGAIKSGQTSLIDLLLRHNAGVHGLWTAVDGDHHKLYLGPVPTTPLAEAVQWQDKDLLDRLESLGAFDCIYEKGHLEAAVTAAVESGDDPYLQRLLSLLPQEVIDSSFGSGSMWADMVAFAISIPNIQGALELLNAGVRPSSSALREALAIKNKILVEVILESGRVYNEYELSPFFRQAAKWGWIPILQDMSLSGMDIGRDRDSSEAVAAAVALNNREVVEWLLDHGCDLRGSNRSAATPLGVATKTGNHEMMRLLVSRGADTADSMAFCNAIEQGAPTLHTLVELFREAYPHGKNSFGGAALIAAVSKGDLELLDTLLSAGLDANHFTYANDIFHIRSFTSRIEITALGFAIQHQNGRGYDLVQKLLDAGNDPNVRVYRKGNLPSSDVHFYIDTALNLAVRTRNEKMVQLLVRNGAKVRQPARLGVRRTPLQLACEINSLKMVKLLLDLGASASEPPARWHGATALQLAARNGNIGVVQLLLDHGAVVDEAPGKTGGFTAIEGAAQRGRISMIQFLGIKVGAKGFAQDQLNKAQSLADKEGYEGCAMYIASLGRVASPLPWNADSLMDMAG